MKMDEVLRDLGIHKDKLSNLFDEIKDEFAQIFSLKNQFEDEVLRLSKMSEELQEKHKDAAQELEKERTAIGTEISS